MALDKEYWDKKHQNNETGWDIGYPSPPLTDYIDQLNNKDIKILIPGCGNAYEGAYLMEQGFVNTYIIDLSPTALENFENQFPNFPKENIICGDFFEHNKSYDLILEQTFFCALEPNLRPQYASHMNNILKPKGKLVGVLFNFPLKADGPPFGGSKPEYLGYFKPYFKDISIETCHNSIKPRQGNEEFIILKK